ncbi:MAG: LacI family DNA-binding transcriptional regulator [Lachnospiraceae bacterium]|nr:LacI family DNA-binding transcriptional regulator [Lachnospiraceae bacterium]
MASIRDVAKKAGVATSTVSKVLNNYPNVSEETKKKVEDAIRELNFIPNAAAAALSSKQTGRIALLINEKEQSQAIDEIDMQYLTGAIVRAREKHMDVQTIFFSMLKEKSYEDMVNYLRAQSIEGLVIFGLSKNDTEIIRLINSKMFKCVCVDAPMVSDVSSTVWVDQYKAQYDIAKEMLLHNPAKSILYLAGKKNSFVMEGRLKAINDIAKEQGITLKVEQGDFSEKKAREITLKSGKKYDLIMCASDMMAIGAMLALTDLDIFRPVAGFDGITLMGYAGKKMTTVKQGFKEIARAAVDEVESLLLGNPGKEIIMPHKIVRIEYLDVIH